MKVILLLLSLFFVFSCATQPMPPDVLQSKLALGMSSYDVMALVGFPEQKTDSKLIYPGYVFNFSDNKLTGVQNTAKEAVEDLKIKDISQQNPSYAADSLVLNKDLRLELSAYQIAGYSHDENLFLKAVESGINPNGFTIRSNALCVALSEGFSKGAEAVMKAGYNPDIQLRTDKGTYMFPPQCVNLQKDKALAEQYKKQVDESVKTQSTKVNAEGKKEESKSLVDWQEVKEFLKPVSPPPTSKINR